MRPLSPEHATAQEAMLRGLRSAVQHAPTSEILKPREKERLLKVRGMLGKGVNPYTKEELDKAGRNTTGARERVLLVREPTEAEILEKEALWKSGVSLFPARNRGYRGSTGEAHINEEFGIEDDFSPAVGAPMVYCTFCGAEVEEATATREKGTTRIACPAHSLKIVNVRFPESEG